MSELCINTQNLLEKFCVATQINQQTLNYLVNLHKKSPSVELQELIKHVNEFLHGNGLW